MGRKGVVADIFSGVSGVYDRFVSLITFGSIHKWQERLIELMGDEGRWLDVGTGTGELLRKLQNANLKVGIDIAKGMLQVAKSKCGDCHFVLADAENLPFREGAFDRVSLSLVFRHLENQEAFLRELERITRSTSRVGILDVRRFKGSSALAFLMKTLLLPLGLLVFGKEKWDFFIHSIENSFPEERVALMLREHGFKTVKVERRFFGLVFLIVGEKI